MKYLLLILLLVGVRGYSQTTYYIRADSTKLEKVGGNNDLILKNSTRSRTGAYLKNISNGITGFFYAIDSAWMATDSTLVVRRGDGNDTLLIRGSGISTTPGIDDVLAVGQALTANRDINMGGGWLLRFYESAPRYLSYDGYDFNMRTSGGQKFDVQILNGSSETSQLKLSDGEFLGYTQSVALGTQAKVRTNQDIAEIITIQGPDQASAVAFYSAGVLRTGVTIHPQNSINYGVDVDNVVKSVKIGKAVLTNTNNYRGLRVDSLWQVYLDSIDAGGVAADSVLVIQADGKVKRRDAAAFAGSASTVPISGLTAATAGNSINNAGFAQQWQWNNLTNSVGLQITSNSTVGTGSGSNTLAQISRTGANANSSVTTYALSLSAGNSGTSSTNYGLSVSASNGTNNYALVVPSSGGSVGIGTVTPAKIFHTVGTVRHASLGTASGDTTTYKPLGIDANGDVFPMTYWPGGGGGGSPAGSNTQVQYNNSGAFGASANFVYDGAIRLTTAGGIGSGFEVTSTSSYASIDYINDVSNRFQTGMYPNSLGSKAFFYQACNCDIGFTTNNTERLLIAGGGAITISNLAGTGSRNVVADASGVLSAPVSDRTVKKNVNTVYSAIGKIMKLRPVNFEYIDGWKNYGQGQQIGFIAQEVREVMPNSVFVTPTTNKLGFNINDMIPLLVSGMQEQQKQIEELKKEIEILKRRK